MSTATLTRAEEAYRALRQVIVRQELPPGTWLRQRAIAAKLGMSPTPLVQAFQRLEHEGLVECVPQWGVRLRTLTVPEFDQVFRMRLAMEVIVFRELACKAPEVATAINRLRPLAGRVDQEDEILIRDGRETGAYDPEDHEFHLALARLSGLTMVVREIDRLCLVAATAVVLIPHPPRVTTHVELLDAIASGNGAIAERAIRDNLEPNMQHSLVGLRERFGDGPIIWRKPETDPANPQESETS